ncbi:MAG: riboflavin biosynthesis protein RibF [Oscillospiraceae bacterium]|jgi:riboflavin kinase/FMN adenylyltransferase|nr:riboflavin biosynthesis protein RibF [Oscillospiraceae bacterium]
MSVDPENGIVIALGFFDGVHRGHAELIKTAKKRAEQLGVSPAVLSFDASPESVVTGHAVPLIGSVRTREDLVRRLFGVDRFIVCHFDRRMMALPWQDFIDSLIARHSAVHLVIGHDFRCGHRGEGNPARILDYCRARSVGCDIIPEFALDGTPVSSSYIRGLIREGDIGKANRFLGHPFIYAGTVLDGRKLGRKLGAPTINLTGDDKSLILPANGVYATRALIDGEALTAVTNVGCRPTFGIGAAISVETHILDFSGDLYGRYMRIAFYEFLRAEQKFEDKFRLSAQIAEDARRTRAFFSDAG